MSSVPEPPRQRRRKPQSPERAQHSHVREGPDNVAVAASAAAPTTRNRAGSADVTYSQELFNRAPLHVKELFSQFRGQGRGVLFLLCIFQLADLLLGVPVEHMAFLAVLLFIAGGVLQADDVEANAVALLGGIVAFTSVVTWWALSSFWLVLFADLVLFAYVAVFLQLTETEGVLFGLPRSFTIVLATDLLCVMLFRSFDSWNFLLCLSLGAGAPLLLLHAVDVVFHHGDDESQGVGFVHPDVFKACVCPLTGHLMRDPVVASDGHTYERSAIKAHIARSPETAESPVTGVRIKTDLVPNEALRLVLSTLGPAAATSVGRVRPAAVVSESKASPAAQKTTARKAKTPSKAAKTRERPSATLSGVADSLAPLRATPNEVSAAASAAHTAAEQRLEDSPEQKEPLTSWANAQRRMMSGGLVKAVLPGTDVLTAQARLATLSEDSSSLVLLTPDRSATAFVLELHTVSIVRASSFGKDGLPCIEFLQPTQASETSVVLQIAPSTGSVSVRDEMLLDWKAAVDRALEHMLGGLF